MNSTKNKPRRFRFSIRAILILFVLIAITAGIIGRPVNNYLRENRVAKSLEDAGAEIKLEVVPPASEWVERFLYRIGYRSAFRRIVQVNFEYGDTFSAELAEQMAELPNLAKVDFHLIPLSNEQLKILARSKSLEDLTIAQETKAVAWHRLTVATPFRMKAMHHAISQLRFAQSAPNETDTAPVTLTDEGVLALKNHPTLRQLTLLGCHVSDDTYDLVLRSLSVENRDLRAEEALFERRLFEIDASGLELGGRPIPNSEKAAFIVPGRFNDLVRLKYILPASAKWELRFPLALRDYLSLIHI